jgi:hypothetical protein
MLAQDGLESTLPVANCWTDSVDHHLDGYAAKHEVEEGTATALPVLVLDERENVVKS